MSDVVPGISRQHFIPTLMKLLQPDAIQGGGLWGLHQRGRVDRRWRPAGASLASQAQRPIRAGAANTPVPAVQFVRADMHPRVVAVLGTGSRFAGSPVDLVTSKRTISLATSTPERRTLEPSEAHVTPCGRIETGSRLACAPAARPWDPRPRCCSRIGGKSHAGDSRTIRRPGNESVREGLLARAPE